MKLATSMGMRSLDPWNSQVKIKKRRKRKRELWKVVMSPLQQSRQNSQKAIPHLNSNKSRPFRRG